MTVVHIPQEVSLCGHLVRKRAGGLMEKVEPAARWVKRISAHYRELPECAEEAQAVWDYSESYRRKPDAA